MSSDSPVDNKKPAVQIAIYTRKSNDENLMGEVTSMDAQRGACRAYISIQKERGWQESSEIFDDPNESGKDLKRPAVRRLIKAVEEGRIQGVIVYKLDRLTRNKRDFDNLLDLFEKHNVALISATESIDTKSPQGRLMVAILMQFAQYDREMDVERSKDFHFARAKKGLWCGGLPPLGYELKDKLLVAIEEEVKLVRRIFELYLEHKSAFLVADEINRLGFQRKAYRTQTGRMFGGKLFDSDAVIRILQRKVYIGMITNERSGQDFPGLHQAIVSTEIFEAAQELLKSHARREGPVVQGPNKHGFLLKGLIRCGQCRGAVVSEVQARQSKVYRYYKCIAKVNGLPVKCPFISVGAGKIEEYVIEKLAIVGHDRPLLERVVRKVKELSHDWLGPLENEKRNLAQRLEVIGPEISNLLKVIKSHGSSEEVSRELRRLEAAKGELEKRIGELEAKIGYRKRALYDVDVIEAALQRFAKLFYKMPLEVRVQTVRLLVKQVTVFKEKIRVELHELPIAALQRALEMKTGGNGGPSYSSRDRRDGRGLTCKKVGRTTLHESGKTGGVDGI